MIEIAYAIYDTTGTYYYYLATSMVSVMENTREKLRFHLLCDATLSQQTRDEFQSWCEKYGNQICFYDVVLDERYDQMELMRCGYNEGTLFRLYLTRLLPGINRIIYLDVDLVLHADIRDLWEVELGDCVMAGRWDPPVQEYDCIDPGREQRLNRLWEQLDWSSYVNAGVLLLDLKKVREEYDLVEESVVFFRTFGMAFPDQDALNYLFRGKVYLLPMRFNVRSYTVPRMVRGYFYHYARMDGYTEKMDVTDEFYLYWWRKTPYYVQEYSLKETVLFLRSLHSMDCMYRRLNEMQLLDTQRAYYYARVLCEIGKYEEAVSLLQEKRWDEPEPHLVSGLSEQERAKRVQTFREGRAEMLVRALLELGEGQKAAAVCDRFLQEETERAQTGKAGYFAKTAASVESRLNIGTVYYRIGAYPKAEEVLKSAVVFGDYRKNYYAVCALRLLVALYVKQGNYKEAEQYNNRLLCASPPDTRARIMAMKLEKIRRKAENLGSGEA